MSFDNKSKAYFSCSYFLLFLVYQTPCFTSTQLASKTKRIRLHSLTQLKRNCAFLFIIYTAAVNCILLYSVHKIALIRVTCNCLSCRLMHENPYLCLLRIPLYPIIFVVHAVSRRWLRVIPYMSY